MKRFLGVLLVLVLVVSLATIGLPSPVQAATFTVISIADTTDANPGNGICDDGTGKCTLRAAIQETNALAGPDTINLPSGNYTLSIAGANEDAAATGDLDITDNLTIIGADQVTTIIDGGGIDRVFQVHSGNVDISSITVQSGNVTGDGGGIHNKGMLTLTNCTFSNNSASGGGGMFNSDSSPIVTNCVFFDNSAGWGGGMYNNDSSPMVTDCTFYSNSAINGAGGMYNHDYSSATVAKCVFFDNSAGWGGGMQNHKSSPTVTNCIFWDNSVTAWGGGMNNDESSPTVINCTFYSNSASIGGGAMSNGKSSPTVTNCIFWDNSDEIANDVTSTPLVTYSDIKGGYSGATNIDDNPLFVDPPGDDFHLQSGSPCIDKGTNVGTPAEDIEGNPRPIDGDGIAGAITDMGAYEYVPLTVTNTNDSGSGSLRQAILDANANSGMDTITFNITGVGPHTIQPTSALPTITDPVIIDGYTEPGASPNTNGPGLGTNAVLMIELDGTNAGVLVDGLFITAGNSTVRGLVINRFSRHGVHLETNGGNVIEGSFIGIDVTGSADLGNAGHGIGIYGSSSGNTIGGTTAGARNVISGNEDRGVGIFESTSNLVQGNFIGTDITGTVDLGNSASGVAIFYSGASGNIIGGTTAEARNVISGNDLGGVSLWNDVTGNLVQGNFIGTDVTGTVDLGNGWHGVGIADASNNIIGGTTSGAGNIISGNDMTGVSITTSNGNLVQGNFIFSNAGLGIDLGGDGVTPNDGGDGDTGANNLQNFPVLTSATSSSGTTIEGTLNSIANTEFRLEFFSNSACDPSGHGEGEQLLGSKMVTTDGSGDVSFTVTFPITVPVGHSITTTATDPNNNTSEFSQCVEVTAAPTPPPVEVGGEVYPMNKLAILSPWIALAIAIIAGATMAMRRRRA